MVNVEVLIMKAYSLTVISYSYKILLFYSSFKILHSLTEAFD